MPLPPPLPDPHHIETRLLIVAEMLERAVDEVRRAMVELTASTPRQFDDGHDEEKDKP